MEKHKARSLNRRILHALRNHFVVGILVIVPIGAAVAILYWVFITIDSIVQPVIELIFGYRITGLGFIVAIVLIYVVGVIASNYVGRVMVRYVDSFLNRIPLFRQLYGGSKQVVEWVAGSGRQKAVFREVVLVEFPRKGMRTLAFTTNEMTDESGKKVLSLYIPTAPVPTSGYFELVTEDMVTRTNLSVDEAMRTIVSSGIIAPENMFASRTAQSESAGPETSDDE